MTAFSPRLVWFLRKIGLHRRKIDWKHCKNWVQVNRLKKKDTTHVMPDIGDALQGRLSHLCILIWRTFLCHVLTIYWFDSGFSSSHTIFMILFQFAAVGDCRIKKMHKMCLLPIERGLWKSCEKKKSHLKHVAQNSSILCISTNLTVFFRS